MKRGTAGTGPTTTWTLSSSRPSISQWPSNARAGMLPWTIDWCHSTHSAWLMLAETTGIDLVKLRDALMMSSGASDALKEWDMISFTWALKDMQVVAEMTDKAGLSLPITGAIKELVKEARRIKASNPPNWTGKGPTKYS